MIQAPPDRAGFAFLIHWNREEAERYARAIRELGWRVTTESANSDTALTRIVYTPPDVVVIWLDYASQRGIRAAYSVRCLEATNKLPILFVGGDRETLAEARRMVPDANYVPASQFREVFGAKAPIETLSSSDQSILSGIVLEVRSLERSSRIYAGALGLRPIQQSECAGEWLTFSAGACRITLLKQQMPATCRGTRLKFQVADLPATLEALQEAGACMEESQWRAGMRTCEGIDPDGNILMLESCCSA